MFSLSLAHASNLIHSLPLTHSFLYIIPLSLIQKPSNAPHSLALTHSPFMACSKSELKWARERLTWTELVKITTTDQLPEKWNRSNDKRANKNKNYKNEWKSFWFRSINYKLILWIMNWASGWSSLLSHSLLDHECQECLVVQIWLYLDLSCFFSLTGTRKVISCHFLS